MGSSSSVVAQSYELRVISVMFWVEYFLKHHSYMYSKSLEMSQSVYRFSLLPPVEISGWNISLAFVIKKKWYENNCQVEIDIS